MTETRIQDALSAASSDAMRGITSALTVVPPPLCRHAARVTMPVPELMIGGWSEPTKAEQKTEIAYRSRNWLYISRSHGCVMDRSSEAGSTGTRAGGSLTRAEPTNPAAPVAKTATLTSPLWTEGSDEEHYQSGNYKGKLAILYRYND